MENRTESIRDLYTFISLPLTVPGPSLNAVSSRFFSVLYYLSSFCPRRRYFGGLILSKEGKIHNSPWSECNYFGFIKTVRHGPRGLLKWFINIVIFSSTQSGIEFQIWMSTTWIGFAVKHQRCWWKEVCPCTWHICLYELENTLNVNTYFTTKFQNMETYRQ